MSIGESIKRLRQNKELKQYELADMLGVAQSTVQHWETGRNEPSIFNCIVMADYFNITLDELVGRKVSVKR